jgi:hypothetical protein
MDKTFLAVTVSLVLGVFPIFSHAQESPLFLKLKLIASRPVNNCNADGCGQDMGCTITCPAGRQPICNSASCNPDGTVIMSSTCQCY